MFESILSTTELEQISSSPETLIVDCRFSLANTNEGRNLYETGHIPGAVFCDLNQDLSTRITPLSSRHPLPAAEDFQKLLGSWGVTPRTQVVCYDNDSGSMAAGRLWWMLKICGHQAAAVLNGGYPAWMNDGRPVEIVSPKPREAVQNGYVFNPLKYISTIEMEQMHRDRSALVVDARSAVRYAGLEEPLDTTGGHIPGAVNLPYLNLLDDEGKLLPSENLHAILSKLLQSTPPARTGIYCGSGVTSILILLAMESIGLKGARIYPGSWSEWIRDGKHPIAAGARI